MTTLTSTGNVNLTSSTNWSPAQIPVEGDDLIIGGHTLTLDADLRLDSITISSSATRFAISGTLRSVEATNGFTVTTGFSSTLFSTAIGPGTSLTLTGKWIINAGFFDAIADSTGGNLTLQTVGASASSVLFEGISGGSGFRVITKTWSGGTLTTIGLFNLPSWGEARSIVTISGGLWVHESSGVNIFGAGGHRIVLATGTATINWTGSVSSQSNTPNGGVFQSSSSSASHTIGQPGDTFALTNSTNSINSFTALLNFLAGTVELAGKWCCAAALDGFAFVIQSSATIRYRNQSLTLASNETFAVLLPGGNLDISGLQITNSGKVAVLEYGSGTLTVSAGTAVTNTTADSQTCVWGTNAMNGKIVVLESDPPTLPSIEDVAAGVEYGYAGVELTGTGLIVDPSVLASGVSAALENISATALARFVTVDTGETEAVAGSVASFGGSGGSSFPETAPANWINAAAIAANALAGKGDWSTHNAESVWGVSTRTITGGTITTNNDKSGYSLSTAQVAEIVAEIEAELADDATGEAIKQAIVTKLIENLPDLNDLSLAAIADAVWGRPTRTLSAFGFEVVVSGYASGQSPAALVDLSGVDTLLERITATIRTAAEDATAETAQTSAIRSGLALKTDVDAAAQSVIDHGDDVGLWGATGAGGGPGGEVDSEGLATAISSRLAVLAMRRLGDASRLVSDVTVTRGTTWRIPISSDDLPGAWTRIEFTARAKQSDSQAESLVHVVRSNPSVVTDGLKILRSQPASNASAGVITIVDDRPIASIAAAATADVIPGEYCWDAKITTASGVDQISRGTLFVEPDVTRV